MTDTTASAERQAHQRLADKLDAMGEVIREAHNDFMSADMKMAVDGLHEAAKALRDPGPSRADFAWDEIHDEGVEAALRAVRGIQEQFERHGDEDAVAVCTVVIDKIEDAYRRVTAPPADAGNEGEE